MNRIKFLLLTCIVSIATFSHAQQKVSDGTAAAVIDPNAILDLQSASKGLLLPRVALSATNNTSPLTAHVKGMAVYNTATAGTAPNNVTPGYYYNDGTQWVRLIDAATEPWNVATTTNQATSNTQDIYQTGKVSVNTSLPRSTLTVNGSFAGQYRIVTASTTIDATDFYVSFNGSAAGTITLPAATALAPAAGNILGRMYHIKNTSTVALTVAASGSELIDWTGTTGLSTFTVPAGGYALLISKGTTGATTTWELVLLYAPTSITTIACVQSGTDAAGTDDPVNYTGTALTDFNASIPQVIPFRTTTFPSHLVINQGGSAVWNDAGSYWDIKESGVYKLEAYAYFGSGGTVSPNSTVYRSSTSGSFTSAGAEYKYTNAFIGVNLNITRNGTANTNIIGGSRANIDNLTAGIGNSQISTSCIVHLDVGDKIYLTMNLGFGSAAVTNAHINTPNNLKQNRYFSLQQLSTP